MKRDFLSLRDLSRPELEEILSLAKRLKDDWYSGRPHPLLFGRTLAMIFEKPSLRTHVTFDVGMFQLGGHAVYLTPADIQLGKRETVADAARNLDRWVDILMARVYRHTTLEELARWASVPVVNGLSDRLHPCQVLSDCFTLRERGYDLGSLRIAFIGDGNNMAHSWINAASRFGFELILACPSGYEPDQEIVRTAVQDGARVSIVRDPHQAADRADVVYTDTWTSMGQEAEAKERRRAFSGYQVNAELLGRAKPSAVVMHCLPAHRGEEITDEVIDGPQSIVFDQAENRLHVQKAILVWLVQHSQVRRVAPGKSSKEA
ncbi:MAG: ornithine carbamoyltransferase [Candidatus Binatia bacterium]|nr:MAG: ornithine carbamoyltransferase [Candidatus Binatia bacterium]